jgi:hypothetical protein
MSILVNHSAGLEAGKLVYVNHHLNMFAHHCVLTVPQHRSRVERHTPWSHARFEAAEDFVRSTPGTRLVSLEDACGDARMHLLCIQFVGSQEHRLVAAMAQIEYAQDTTTDCLYCKFELTVPIHGENCHYGL